jgi:hypothetical protein
MGKFRIVIIATLAVVGVHTFLMIHQQSKLREENSLLRQQIEQLAPLQAENGHLSNLLAQANNAQTLPSAQLSELLRLRSEVGSLRSQTNDLGKLQSENQRLRSSLLTPTAGTQTSLTREGLPKQSWGLVGYANPESAFQSAVWAMSQGDAKAFRASIAPGSGMFTDFQDKSDSEVSTQIKGEADKVTAFKILDKAAINDDTAILTVMAEGVNEVGRFKLQRVGEEWKLAGPVNEGAAPETK